MTGIGLKGFATESRDTRPTTVALPRATTPARRFRRWMTGPAGTPVISVIACGLMLTSLLTLATSETVQERWTLVTAQAFVTVDSADFDPEAFAQRNGAIAAADLESNLTIATGAAKGEIHANLTCLARNVYFEARNEELDGQIAVAHVVMNRVATKRFPDSACDVVHQGVVTRKNGCQFSWWCDGKEDEIANAKAWALAQDVAHDVYWGRLDDPTEGALWYHADYVKPVWRKALSKSAQIGRHLFYVKRAKSKFEQVAEAPDLI